MNSQQRKRQIVGFLANSDALKTYEYIDSQDVHWVSYADISNAVSHNEPLDDSVYNALELLQSANLLEKDTHESTSYYGARLLPKEEADIVARCKDVHVSPGLEHAILNPSDISNTLIVGVDETTQKSTVKASVNSLGATVEQDLPLDCFVASIPQEKLLDVWSIEGITRLEIESTGSIDNTMIQREYNGS